jgi:CheY-like chemotaxis protein
MENDPSLPRGEPKVLVVDDQVANRDLLTRLLRRDGVDVLTAATGAEAIAAYCRYAPALVLLDLNMPGVDGFEFLKWLKSDPPGHRAPVIVLTAHSDRESVQKAAHLGAAGYIVKPFEGDDIRERVRGMLAEAEADCALV